MSLSAYSHVVVCLFLSCGSFVSPGTNWSFMSCHTFVSCVTFCHTGVFPLYTYICHHISDAINYKLQPFSSECQFEVIDLFIAEASSSLWQNEL